MRQQKSFPVYQKSEQGVALISALLLLILMSALAVALLYKVNYEQHLQRTDSGNNFAFYGAEAGMEKMVADLNGLYNLQAAPSCADIAALTTNYPPASDIGVTYSQYQITLPDGSVLSSCTTPPSRVQTISQGANAGLQAQVVPLKMMVTSLTPGGESVSMIRQVEVARIPIFQFGVFSQSDLSYFPGPDFDFKGRVHTNGNLFLAVNSGATLAFHSQIRAAGDVVRDQLANGESTSSQSRTGKVMIPIKPGACDTGSDALPTTSTNPNCRPLAITEGSSNNGPTPTYSIYGTGTPNSGWKTISLGANPYYNSMVLSGSTDAKKLEMAFVKTGVDPIEIIRRPRDGESATSSVAESRLYNQAQIRVLISDNPAENHPDGSAVDNEDIRLANYVNNGGSYDYTNGVPVDGSSNRTYFAEGITGTFPDPATGLNITDSNWVKPPVPASSVNTLTLPASDPAAPVIGTTPATSKTWNLLDGYLRVEYRQADGSYKGVTREWLELGFARGFTPPNRSITNPVNPNAILILQELADRNADTLVTAGQAAYSDSPTPQTYCDNKSKPSVPAGATCDAWTNVGKCNSNKNKQWSRSCSVNHAAVVPELANGGTGYYTGDATRHNWYPINMYDTREGEFRDTASGTCKVNGILNLVEIDVGNLRKWLKGTIGTNGPNVEYVTQNGYILYFSDRRGMKPNDNLSPKVKNGEYGFEDVLNGSSSTGTPNNTLDAGEDVNGNKKVDTWGKANLGLGFGTSYSGDPTKTLDCTTLARANWVSGARHGVRLVNGSLGKVPTRFDNDGGGFTLASENPAYILGDYNADGSSSSPFGDPHASTAVIADTVTLLSNGFSDLTMFNNPTAPGSRSASNTWYRVAIATGKNINFLRSGISGSPPPDFGTDGGVHNFLRFLENWSGKDVYYKGSMASMYYSMYATGIFKCCTTVYGAPDRNYAFDLDFEDISKMPPGTPTVRDVVNLGFQQVF